MKRRRLEVLADDQEVLADLLRQIRQKLAQRHAWPKIPHQQYEYEQQQFQYAGQQLVGGY